MKKSSNTFARNKRAYHDFEIMDEFEAGIELKGSEVKSIRAGNCNLKGSHIIFNGPEMWVTGMHVAHYPFSQEALSPERDRKVFLHKKTIEKLAMKSREKGMAVVPTALYLKNNRIKIKIALARGKKLHDKKQVLKNRDQEREKEREASRFVRG